MPHDSCDALRALIKEWQNGLTFKSVNFGEAHVEHEGNIVLVARPFGGQDYRLVIRPLPDRQVESDASCWTGSNDCRPDSGGPVPNRNQAMMYALPPEFIQGPKGSATLRDMAEVCQWPLEPQGGGVLLFVE